MHQSHNNQSNNMGRGKAWFSEADFQLAQAWVQASQDPIIGTNQDGKSFWQTIKANFMKLSKTNEERSISSLQSRWSDINKKATKFNGTYLQLKRLNRSGFNEEKYLEEALKLYKEETSEDFPFLSIWHYLKDKPKWTVNKMKKKEAPKKGNDEKKPVATATSSGSGDSGDIVDVSPVDDDEDYAARPIGQKKAKQLRDAAQRQVEADEKAAQAMQSRAETHKLQLEFKLFNSMGDTEEAREWKELVAQQFLFERKRAINERKRAAEAEEERLKKKRDQKERLKKEVTPHAIDFSTEKENVTPEEESCEQEEEQQQQQQKINVCCAGDYCFVSNGHLKACVNTCRVCGQSCHYDCCEDDDYGYKVCASCLKKEEV